MLLFYKGTSGKEVERKPVFVDIKNIEIINIDYPNVEIKVECGKGTYIRSLGVDIAFKLNTIGHLIDLQRVSIDNFKIEDSKTLENITLDDGISIKDALNIKRISALMIHVCN